MVVMRSAIGLTAPGESEAVAFGRLCDMAIEVAGNIVALFQELVADIYINRLGDPEQEVAEVRAPQSSTLQLPFLPRARQTMLM